VTRMRALYQEAMGRKGKSRILGQISETLVRSRRTAKRLMTGLPPAGTGRRRKPIYPERLVRMLESVWEAAQFAWSVRLKAVLPLWMPWIRQRWALSPQEQRLLLKMSPATMSKVRPLIRNA